MVRGTGNDDIEWISRGGAVRQDDGSADSVVDVPPDPENSGEDLGVCALANAPPQTVVPLDGGILGYMSDPTGNECAPVLHRGDSCDRRSTGLVPIKKVRTLWGPSGSDRKVIHS